MILNISNAPAGPLDMPLYDVVSGAAPTFTPSGNNWEMTFRASGTIKFRRLTTAVDVCVVAGGMPGASGAGSGAAAVGGDGGKGGQVVNVYRFNPTLLEDYTITVGKSGQNSAAFGYSASTGGGSNGGSGAKQDSNNHDSTPGADGVCAFGGTSGTKYGAGGGGGAAQNNTMGYWKPGSNGGASGGGNGGTGNGGNGTDGTGGGGAGGAAYHRNTSTATNYIGGAGGSGIVIIRNAR